MRRILVVGGASPLGRALIARLASRRDVDCVRGIEARPPRGGARGRFAGERTATGRDATATATTATAATAAAVAGEAETRIDVVPFVPDPRPLAELLAKQRIDTVVQADLVPDRCGLSRHAREAEVLGAMCLGAAIGRADSPVRSWIVVSSSAIYPIGSQTALLHGESDVETPDPSGIAASIAEAEDYARETAVRLPHVDVALLRFQSLAGDSVGSALAGILARDPVPSAAGFDPAIQLLHVEDAIDALIHAITRELAGVYNVASAGLIRLGDAVRFAGRRPLPLLPVPLSPVEPLLARLGIPFLPAELAALLRHGHAIDTAKLERTGWRPRFDQRACVRAIGRG